MFFSVQLLVTSQASIAISFIIGINNSSRFYNKHEVPFEMLTLLSRTTEGSNCGRWAKAQKGINFL